MGHAIKHKRNLKIEKEEKEFTLSSLTAGFDRFPTYCDIFQETHTTLLSGNGPLPEATRHFIARMACKAGGCELLTKMEEQCFLNAGGNAKWLEDSDSVPAKLKQFEALCVLLKKSIAFLNYKHIKNLTEGTDSWTLAELVQAFVIIVYFHGLSSFPVGTKINQPTANDKFVNGAETELKLQKISEKLELIEAVNPEGFPKLHDKELKRKRSFSEGEVLSKITKQIVAKETCDMMKLINETGNIENKIQIQDYCWDEEGFSVLSTFYSDIAVLLDDKFRTARLLSPNNDRTQNDNKKFKTAVWNFVEVRMWTPC